MRDDRYPSPPVTFATTLKKSTLTVIGGAAALVIAAFLLVAIGYAVYGSGSLLLALTPTWYSLAQSLGQIAGFDVSKILQVFGILTGASILLTISQLRKGGFEWRKHLGASATLVALAWLSYVMIITGQLGESIPTKETILPPTLIVPVTAWLLLAMIAIILAVVLVVKEDLQYTPMLTISFAYVLFLCIGSSIIVTENGSIRDIEVSSDYISENPVVVMPDDYSH